VHLSDRLPSPGILSRAPPKLLRTVQNCSGRSGNGFGASKIVPDAPKTVPGASKVIPDAPKTVPDAPKVVPDAPKTVPDAPEVVPDAPKTVPDAPKTVPDAPETVPDAPEVVPEGPATVSSLPKTFRTVRKLFRCFRNGSGCSGNCFGAPESLSGAPEIVLARRKSLPAGGYHPIRMEDFGARAGRSPAPKGRRHIAWARAPGSRKHKKIKAPKGRRSSSFPPPLQAHRPQADCSPLTSIRPTVSRATAPLASRTRVRHSGSRMTASAV